MLPFNSIVSTLEFGHQQHFDVECRGLNQGEPPLGLNVGNRKIDCFLNHSRVNDDYWADFRLADCITVRLPSAGIACTQTDTVSPIALWSTGSMAFSV